MHNIYWAVDQLESGKAVKRTDWGLHYAFASLELHEQNSEMQLYMRGMYSNEPDGLTEYGFTFPDMLSTKWVIAIQV